MLFQKSYLKKMEKINPFSQKYFEIPKMDKYLSKKKIFKKVLEKKKKNKGEHKNFGFFQFVTIKKNLSLF
jgi:hypothetical protein